MVLNFIYQWHTNIVAAWGYMVQRKNGQPDAFEQRMLMQMFYALSTFSSPIAVERQLIHP